MCTHDVAARPRETDIVEEPEGLVPTATEDRLAELAQRGCLQDVAGLAL